MSETLLNVALAAVILLAAGLVTHTFTKLMYFTCGSCGTLNAKRRSECRECGARLPE